MIDFWATIGENRLRSAGDVEGALKSVSLRLGEASAEDLEEFTACLHRNLYLLDRREFAAAPVVLSDGREFAQTSDHFLYARCACILAGKTVFDRVLEGNADFRDYVITGVQSAEEILYLALDRYENITGRPLKTQGAFSIEWMSNPDGWPHE